MIFPNQKEYINQVLGKQPGKKIMPYLKKKKLKNARGQDFSPKSLQLILDGEYDNLEVEEHIWQFMKEYEIRKKKLEKLKKVIIDGTPNDVE